MLLAEACSMMGFYVITAPSGAEALEIIRGNRIGAAFIDMKMPGLSGLDTLLQVRQIRPELKTFLMTGYDENCLMEEAMRSGAQGVILKPFDLEEIRCLLESI